MQGLSPRPMLTIYMGDDWTDEIAFERLSAQAITIKIGPPAPASRAQYRLEDVGAAHALLGGLAGLGEVRGAA
jgi:trehalose-6-phosphatase